MRAILACGGDGTRWTGAVPKHLVDVEGERLLDRTVRQLIARGVDDIAIVAPLDPEYEIMGAVLYAPEIRGADLDKVLSSRLLWTADTLIVCGDVWFSDAAMAALTGGAPADFRVFGRRHASKLTGHRHGEIFALRFVGGVARQLERHAQELRHEALSGRLRRAKLWELYQTLIGQPPNPFGRQVFDAHWHEINDWTDDFDTVLEYQEWRQRRANADLS